VHDLKVYRSPGRFDAHTHYFIQPVNFAPSIVLTHFQDLCESPSPLDSYCTLYIVTTSTFSYCWDLRTSLSDYSRYLLFCGIDLTIKPASGSYFSIGGLILSQQIKSPLVTVHMSHTSESRVSYSRL